MNFKIESLQRAAVKTITELSAAPRDAALPYSGSVLARMIADAQAARAIGAGLVAVADSVIAALKPPPLLPEEHHHHVHHAPSPLSQVPLSQIKLGDI